MSSWVKGIPPGPHHLPTRCHHTHCTTLSYSAHHHLHRHSLTHSKHTLIPKVQLPVQYTLHYTATRQFHSQPTTLCSHPQARLYVRHTLPLRQARTAMVDKQSEAAVVVDDNFTPMGLVFVEDIEAELVKQQLLLEPDNNFGRPS